MENLNHGVISRNITISKVFYNDASKDIKGIYSNLTSLKEHNPFPEFTCISYNGGGKLVNYGINAFVRDIYILTKDIVAFSDRFGEYNIVEDKDITYIIANSKVHLSCEGVILFYSDNQLYATLNCKVGCIESLDSLLKISDKSYTISRVFSSNEKTYIEINKKETNEKSYYILSFSFNLYESYGTQIKISSEKIDTKYSYDDIIAGKSPDYFEEESIEKSNRILKHSIKTFDVEPTEYKKNYGKKIGCLNKKECISGDYQIDFYKFLCDGDTGVNDCINSFVREFIISRPRIKQSFWSLNSIKRNVLFLIDRFNNTSIYEDNVNDMFTYCENINVFYTSLEGVIVIIYAFGKDVYISISLDGIIWKKYNVKEFVTDLSSDIVSASLSYKYGKNCLTFYERNKESHTLNEGREYIINFTFDFWSLYDSPVKAQFSVVEF